jgi:putative ABC transport system substrate-binding protein
MAARIHPFLSSTKTPRLIMRLWLLLPLLFAIPSRADVVIVKSSDADPYKLAEATLQTELAGPDVKIRSVLVKDLATSGIGSTISTTDTVIAIGTPAASWLHSQLPEGVELVYCMVTNATDAGLAKGSECWGVTTEVAISEQIQLMTEALPHAKTVGVLYRSDLPASADMLKQLQAAVPHDWHVEAVATNDHASIADAIDALSQKNVDIIWTDASLKIYDAAAVRALLLAALRSKTPVWGFSPAFVRAGALLGVGVDPKAQAVQTAALVKDLKDNKKNVKDHIQIARDYQIAVNLIVADQIDIKLPDSLVQRATFVFRGDQ